VEEVCNAKPKGGGGGGGISRTNVLCCNLWFEATAKVDWIHGKDEKRRVGSS
jgi:hypothetical protein